ncbi:biotin--[acetyl-CoA-carboxylase] ligase [Candidatus Anaplasma sp. TIGMIC]|uniref:biotin--[acetyl-CoA-carboxylase] ligase n=1 Tax=Candidatus Anaplasma sp. TIGMIC TaxID=3020713 RepID=UPI00232AE177|nr:biotin--[acetyl-CoA-carboxylase] ligase [Candidatus Anaplasma sp. TIGMIC]MDB1135603.1 biotin--[acetyl-CoA-carboxylase] ligase [Candidatus Anaplasma sp. TIGMIC]
MRPFTIHALETTESTNLEAIELAERGAPGGTVVVAQEQTAGIGRLGRSWDSPRGNLYFSVLLREHLQTHALTFASALSVGITLEQIFCDNAKGSNAWELRYKWPNDVLVNGKKISGVLLQTKAHGDMVPWIVCGVGINVSCHPENATSMKYHIPNLELPTMELLNLVLENFAKLLDVFSASGFSALRNLWLKKAYKMGSNVCITTRSGSKHEGVFSDIDMDGAMVLKSGNDILKVDFGEML